MRIRSYLCHITDSNGSYSQQIVYGIVELKQFLRDNHVRFINGDLSFLQDDSIVARNSLGTTFEIELLVEPNYREIDGIAYITVYDYCNKYNISRKTIDKGIANQKIKCIYLGNGKYIEDKAFKNDRKAYTSRKGKQL